MTKKKRLSFERAFARLETIIEDLDQESNSLEESIAKYEKMIIWNSKRYKRARY